MRRRRGERVVRRPRRRGDRKIGSGCAVGQQHGGECGGPLARVPPAPGRGVRAVTIAVAGRARIARISVSTSAGNDRDGSAESRTRHAARGRRP